jgi:pimeloyl-ACP methyl ester carboxylesterase
MLVLYQLTFACSRLRVGRDRCAIGVTTPTCTIVSGLVGRIIDLLRRREFCWNPAVRITSETVADGIRERLFTIGDVPGVLWTPAEGSGPRPLVLIGHGGGQHKKEPGVLSRAFPYVASCGFAVAAIDAPGAGDRPEHPEIRRLVAEIQGRLAAGEPAGPAWPALNETVASQLIPDWQTTLDALQKLDSVGDSRPVGYYGLSQGGAMGVRLVAAEPRITAAVLGLIRATGSPIPQLGSRSRSSSSCSGTMKGIRGTPS